MTEDEFEEILDKLKISEQAMKEYEQRKIPGPFDIKKFLDICISLMDKEWLKTKNQIAQEGIDAFDKDNDLVIQLRKYKTVINMLKKRRNGIDTNE